jgi:hypothetical protein
MDTSKKDDFHSDPLVTVEMAITFIGNCPSNMSPMEHVTAIICSVVSGTMEKVVRHLDENPDLFGAKSGDGQRTMIMNAATIAMVEQLCAVWKAQGGAKDKLPEFVKMMAALYEETLGASDGEGRYFYPNVGDIGHA